MPYIKIWVHLIWTTKNRFHFLQKNIRLKIFSHIRKNAKEKGIHLDFINGYTDHVHTLISLGSNQSISAVAKTLKGESSHWMNANNLTKTKFGWQDEYIAISVSHSEINRVRDYIKNQVEHHRTRTFEEEYRWFIENHGFSVLRRD